MMTKKILTVVIPTYNMEKYLRRCLDSLIVTDEQMSLLEVLIINDGSKDSSSAIGHEYQDKYPKTYRVIDKENGNYGSCINRGLKEAAGKYIKILDADDWYDNTAFSNYINLLVSVDVDLVLNDMTQINIGGVTSEFTRLSLPKNKEFDMTSYNVFPSMHCVAYRTEKLQKINYHQTEGISYTDQQWVFEPMSTVETAYYFPIILYMYLVGRENQTMNPVVRGKCLGQVIKVTEDMIENYIAKEYNGKQSRWLKMKLLNKISVIYHEIIVELRDDKNQLLIDFDYKLQDKYPELYKEISPCLLLGEKFPYNYGKRWMKNHSVNYSSPVFQIYYSLKSIKRKLMALMR